MYFHHMKVRLQKIIPIVVGLWCAGHLLATVVYTLHWPADGLLAQWSYRYMVPLFHQNWSLFAPNIPEYDAQLIYRSSANDSLVEWTAWNDVSNSCGYDDFSKMEVIEQNILVQLNHQLYTEYYSVNGVPQMDAMVKTAAYSKALYYAGRMHEKRVGPWSSLQIAVVFRFPPTNAPIASAAPDTLFFPPFHSNEIRR